MQRFEIIQDLSYFMEYHSLTSIIHSLFNHDQRWSIEYRPCSSIVHRIPPSMLIYGVESYLKDLRARCSKKTHAQEREAEQQSFTLLKSKFINQIRTFGYIFCKCISSFVLKHIQTEEIRNKLVVTQNPKIHHNLKALFPQFYRFYYIQDGRLASAYFPPSNYVKDAF